MGFKGGTRAFDPHVSSVDACGDATARMGAEVGCDRQEELFLLGRAQDRLGERLFAGAFDCRGERE